MLDHHHTFLSEEYQKYKAEELWRVANELSWLERLAGVAWLPLRPLVRLLGRGLQVTGRELVRRTEATPAAANVTHLDRQAG